MVHVLNLSRDCLRKLSDHARIRLARELTRTSMTMMNDKLSYKLQQPDSADREVQVLHQTNTTLCLADIKHTIPTEKHSGGSIVL